MYFWVDCRKSRKSFYSKKKRLPISNLTTANSVHTIRSRTNAMNIGRKTAVPANIIRIIRSYLEYISCGLFQTAKRVANINDRFLPHSQKF